ncbi:patched domain-containing protein 3-like [Ptychodera flava]|uniref:patched domain-containing protein 3-like n=1 Tax=Ptychodera flava TaxID=63121 RepID=UPI00396A4794
MKQKCHYDFVQRRLSKRFYTHGKFIGKHPIPFLVIPVIVSVALGVGMLLMEQETDIEYLFTPANSKAIRDRDKIDRLFPPGDSEDFIASKQSRVGNYGQVIITASDGDNVLRGFVLQEIFDLHQLITELLVQDGEGIGNSSMTYHDLCGKLSGSCYEAPVLTLYNNYNVTDFTCLNLTYPVHTINDTHKIFLGTSLGGVTFYEDGETIRSAQAMQLNYFLEMDDHDEVRALQNDRWESMFLETMRSYSSLRIQIAYFSSQTLESEVKQLSVRGVPQIAAVTVTLVLIFSVLCCLVMDCVRSKPWLGVLGVVSAGLAVLSAFGLMGYLGVPYINICASMPLLILGIGVDDMFILLAAWRQVPSSYSVEERMGRTFSEAAMSITVTSVTDFLALSIGTVSAFPSVRIFCLYTAIAVLFDYIYQVTFFGACMVLTGRREAANLHCLTFKKVPLKDEPATRAHKEHCMVEFFGKYYGPFITDIRVKVFVVLAFLTYLAIAFAGLLRITEGLDMKNLVADDSYAGRFYDVYYNHFREYGPAVTVALDADVDYSDKKRQDDIEDTLRDFEGSLYFHNNRLVTQSWLRDFLDFCSSYGLDCDDHDSFIRTLAGEFLPRFVQYRSDVVFNDNKTAIVTSRFYVFSRNMTDTNRERNMMLEARRIVNEANLDFFVYSPSFIFYEQYTAVLPNMLQNIGICAAAMFVVSLILIPHPVCSLYIIFFIGTITLGVIGYMGFLGIRLDAIAMINMIICIGFSVDFSAHMTCAFVLAPYQSRDKRAIEALQTLGWPILEGAISTFLGIVAMSTADSYGYRTFFKTMFLVIAIGAAHGVMFLPVFLTLFGPLSPLKKSSVSKEVATCDMKTNSVSVDGRQGGFSYISENTPQCGFQKNKTASVRNEKLFKSLCGYCERTSKDNRHHTCEARNGNDEIEIVDVSGFSSECNSLDRFPCNLISSGEKYAMKNSKEAWAYDNTLAKDD